MRKVVAFLGVVLASSFAAADHEGSSDPLDWLRDAIPGEPGVDYPILSVVEDTGFSCEGRTFGGYYADPEMGCQGYHVCLNFGGFNVGQSDRKISFLCPNGTLFNQEAFTCQWWFDVDCTAAEESYGLNELIGSEEELPDPEEDSGKKAQRNQQRPREQQQRPKPQQQSPRNDEPAEGQINRQNQRPNQNNQRPNQNNPRPNQSNRRPAGQQNNRRPGQQNNRRPNGQNQNRPQSRPNRPQGRPNKPQLGGRPISNRPRPSNRPQRPQSPTQEPDYSSQNKQKPESSLLDNNLGGRPSNNNLRPQTLRPSLVPQPQRPGSTPLTITLDVDDSLFSEDETTVHDDSGEYSIASITTTAVPFLKKVPAERPKIILTPDRPVVIPPTSSRPSTSLQDQQEADDIVQYDAVIPESGDVNDIDDGIPVLFADSQQDTTFRPRGESNGARKPVPEQPLPLYGAPIFYKRI